MDRRFHRPPAWISWVLGLVAMLDILPLLFAAFFVVIAAENHVSDRPPDCDPDHCPATPEQNSRDLAIMCWVGRVLARGRLSDLPTAARVP